MSTAKIIGTVAVLAILIGASYLFLGRESGVVVEQSAAVTSSTTTSSPTIVLPKPKIQVSAKGEVWSSLGSTTPLQLRSGNELEIGSTIETKKGATAVIFFPDGSQARLAQDTRLTLSEARYMPAEQTQVVHLSLSLGRVWSKIIDLATPESRWQVETSNAVATVRGTAFDMGTDGSRSVLFTASNSVSLGVRDPKTKKMIKESAGVISAGKYVAIAATDVVRLQKNINAELSVQIPPRSYSADSWITVNKAADTNIDVEIKKLEDAGKRSLELRDALRSVTEQKIETNPLPDTQSTPKPSTPKATEPSREPTQPAASRAKPVRIDVGSAKVVKELSEGSRVNFIARLHLDDGSVRDVTKEARWQVVGPIGKITDAGQFTAELDPSISETGEGSGSVVAVWIDSTTEENFLGKSAIFRVLIGEDTSAGAAI